MRIRSLPLVMFALAAGFAGCTSGPRAGGPGEFLDEKTAATVSVVSQPLVFARERPELAAHSRDYVTLAAASVNRSGAIDYFIFAYFWSTLDRRDRNSAPAAVNNLTIAADDRQISPQLVGHSTQEAGVGSAVQAPPGHRWTLNVYRSDIATLRFIAESHQLTVIGNSADGAVAYEIWNDRRQALRALVQRLEGAD